LDYEKTAIIKFWKPVVGSFRYTHLPIEWSCLTEAWVKADDPAGMLPKILSGGLLKLFRVGLAFLINSIGHL
jgi:hypothetical protein